MTCRRSWRGVTLVELLVAISLMALVGGAAVAALAGGVRVWERAVALGSHRQAALIAFDRLRRDVQNARRFEALVFEGTYDQLAFAAVEPDASEADAPPELGRLGYFLDPRRQILCRSFVPYRLVKRVRLRDRCQAVLEGVTQVRFAFFGPDPERSETRWVERWRSPDLPTGIRIDLSVRGGKTAGITHSFLVSLTNRTPPPRKDADHET